MIEVRTEGDHGVAVWEPSTDLVQKMMAVPPDERAIVLATVSELLEKFLWAITGDLLSGEVKYALNRMGAALDYHVEEVMAHFGHDLEEEA